jgi:hypothetical protein
MKNLKNFITILVLGALFASCSASIPVIVTDNTAEKMGTAEFKVIFFFFRPVSADISIVKAAKKGGITNVATVDFVIEARPFVRTYKTVVTGN